VSNSFCLRSLVLQRYQVVSFEQRGRNVMEYSVGMVE
jgi:hypothetical protein